MDTLPNFKCTGCGACCKTLDLFGLEELKKNGLKTIDGKTCENLKEDNTCGIYDTRPDMCRVNKNWERLKEEGDIFSYHKRMADMCNRFQIEQNIDKKYRVIL